jgi:glycosyltransferase involved in cell wall biosynthesis
MIEESFNLNLIKNKEGILHLQSHTWEYERYLDKISKNKKIIYTLHSILPYYYLEPKEKEKFLEGKIKFDDFKKNVLKKMLNREKSQLKILEKADYLFTISKNHKKILKLMNVNSPIYVFENVTDFENFSEREIGILKKEADILKNKINSENILLYSGRIGNWKGTPEIFDALRKIKKDYISTKLIILGDNGMNKENLKKLGFDEDISNSLFFIPWIDKNSDEGKKEFLKYYLVADILIHPMITEELYSKTVIDAMYIGLPTITCKSPYSIGSSKNSKEIFESFNYFKENPEKIQQIIKIAKIKTKKENTWKAYLSKMEKILEN